MNLLLVTFSLRNRTRDYDSFFVAIRGNSIQWLHFIEQTYVVATQYDRDEFAQRLYPHMESTDSLLIVTIPPGQYQGWLPSEAWKWLDNVTKTVRVSLPNVPSYKKLL